MISYEIEKENCIMIMEMTTRGLLSFRHTEMVWHTKGDLEARSEAACF